MRKAIKVGYRHFDLAKLYENEAEIGTALNEAIKEGDVQRDDLYICSKLWNTDTAPEDVEPALRECLEKLKLTYIE